LSHKLNLPKKIKVGGHNYKILFPYHFKEVENLGQTDILLKRIRLTDVDRTGNKIAKSQILNTFCHEILHAIDREYNESKLSEEMTIRLANGLFQVLTDNFEIKIKGG